MNLYEQLIVVRERLEGIGAHDDSMDLVETLLKRAEPARGDKTNIGQVQVLRHMSTLNAIRGRNRSTKQRKKEKKRKTSSGL